MSLAYPEGEVFFRRSALSGCFENTGNEVVDNVMAIVRNVTNSEERRKQAISQLMKSMFPNLAIPDYNPRSFDLISIQDPKSFYSHFMVEYVSNKPAYHGSPASREKQGGHKHNRSDFKTVQGSRWNTSYGCWTHLPVLYGDYTKSWNGVRRVQKELCVDGNIFKDQENGTSLKVCDNCFCFFSV